MKMRIECDPQKAEANELKHGVSFSEATTALADPLSITLPDLDHSGSEEPLLLLGNRVLPASSLRHSPSTAMSCG